MVYFCRGEVCVSVTNNYYFRTAKGSNPAKYIVVAWRYAVPQAIFSQSINTPVSEWIQRPGNRAAFEWQLVYEVMMSVVCVTLMKLLFPQTFKQSLEPTMIILSLKGKDLKSFLVENKHGEATVGFSQRGGNRKVTQF